tara:strand:+ start:450 stop:986 length:537 start_codon:yes stop_codon:yes gene_type:complete
VKIPLTLANSLSLSRILITAPAAWSISLGAWKAASLLLIVAILSDILDGPIARSKGQESASGGLLDHACDALLVAVLLFALTNSHEIPLLLPILVLTSFLQYVLDSKALSGHALRTSQLGRLNGIAYFVIASTCIFSEVLGDVLPEYFVKTFSWILVISTLLSMLDRFWTLISKKKSW